MSKIRKLTPDLLRKIIAEEKRKIAREKQQVKSQTRKNRKSSTAKNRKALNEIKALAKLKIEQKKAARKFKKITEARRMLKRRIMRKL